MTPSDTVLGIVAGVAVVAVLVFDLGILQKRAHELSLKKAILWSVFWIFLALAFNLLIYAMKGSEAATEFLSGFLVEKSLSVDNLFVFLLIFSYFQVPLRYQHKVLFWGIFGAIVMRGLLIWAGLQLIETFHWLIYVLGAFLIYTGYKTAFQHDIDKMNLDENPLLKFLNRFLPLTEEYVGDRFVVKTAQGFLLTPLFVVLVMIETTDVLFALDSVPAIIGITKDPLILYTSNLFAILGLRALYFVLSNLFSLFHHLKYAVSAILAFVGTTMIIHPWYVFSDLVVLMVIGSLLGLSIVSSKIWPQVSEETNKNSRSALD